MLRAAVIGCGRIGSTYADDPLVDGIYTHAGAYTSFGGTTLVAVCDQSRDVVARCANRWGVPRWYTNPTKLFAEAQPEVVSICTPDETHADLLKQAVACSSVRAVLAEKPLALTYEEAAEVVEAARARGVLLAVNYTRRYCEGLVSLREALHATVGRVETVTGTYSKGILHNGTHWLDLTRWFVGDAMVLHASTVRSGATPDPDLDVVLSFGAGARGMLTACDAETLSLFELEVTGTEGRVRLYDGCHRAEIWRGGPSRRYTGYRTLHRVDDREVDMRDSLLHAVQDLVDALAKGRSPRCSGGDGLHALKLATDAITAAQATPTA